jgi:hypothetical protein
MPRGTFVHGLRDVGDRISAGRRAARLRQVEPRPGPAVTPRDPAQEAREYIRAIAKRRGIPVEHAFAIAASLRSVEDTFRAGCGQNALA